MEGLTPSQKGSIAELSFGARALMLGYHVYMPMAEGGRCDFILEMGEKLLRVQCKCGFFDAGVVKARLGTSRLTPSGYLRTTYGPDEIDAVAIYCPDLHKCYLLPIALVAGQTYIHLRVEPSLNNQRLGLKWAHDYEFGAIAQLGERRYGIPEVAGSSPASST
jgi:hypothetical protein